MLQLVEHKTKRKSAVSWANFLDEISRLKSENKELLEVNRLQADLINILKDQKKLLMDACGIKPKYT